MKKRPNRRIISRKEGISWQYTRISPPNCIRIPRERPRGVKTFTATASGIGLTRVEIERRGLRRPKGRYITLDMPQFAAIDDRNEAYVWAIASQLRALLPKEGLVW